MEATFRKHKRSLFFKQRLMGYIFLLPTVVLFLIFTVVPFIMAFYLSFFEYNLLEVGELLAAVLGNSELFGSKAMRIIFYLPCITGSIATAYVWRWMFDVDSGVFNGILGMFGLPESQWLSSRSYLVMVCVVMVSVWSGIGNNMLIFLAALKGVSPELYEAAKLDGANKMQTLWYITVPSIAPTMYFITTMSIIGAFQMFDLVYAMVPSNSMEWGRTPVVMIYEIGFTRFRGGLGTAMSIILFAVIMIVTFLFQRVAKEDKTV